MAYHKIEKLIHRLSEQTELGKLAWAESEKSDTYQTAFPNYSVTIGMEEEFGSDQIDFILSIFNNQGEVVERLSFSELSTQENAIRYKLVRLHSAARRIAMGVEAALDSLLGELPTSKVEEKDDEVPF